MASANDREDLKGLQREANYDRSHTSDSMAARLANRIAGKSVVITGVSPRGLGADAARAIYKHNPKLLILASRTKANIQAVIDSIGSPGAGNVEGILLDLSSLDSVRAAAGEVLKLTPVVDVLINNAAVMMVPEYTTTKNGFEMHFGINHLGHFLFTNLLMPALLKSVDGARVVNVSAAAHRMTLVNFEDPNFANGTKYEPLLGYAQSKCANLLFSHALANRYGSQGLLSFGVDPGAVPDTQISRLISKEELIRQGWFNEDGTPKQATILPKTIQQASSSYIMAAFDPAILDHNGACITSCIVDDSVAPYVLDRGNAEKLWVLSEKLIGQEFGS
ncbi:NAD(P)-binding protein [Rhizodiscina lignyota]|uniref:NAD(P)-binding protein n=1 Tax=Rhizodiscina lignyota TaxID=1504668 RepID=A0A9P4I915_9PEZI|nr:NAD(P)-binding protein [Rhizodiscina lignyota]